MSTKIKPWPTKAEAQRQQSVALLRKVIREANAIIMGEFAGLEVMRGMVRVKQHCCEVETELSRAREVVNGRWPNNAEYARLDAQSIANRIKKQANAIVMKDYSAIEILRQMEQLKNLSKDAIQKLESVKGNSR